MGAIDQEKKEEEAAQEIVLKVDMHCEACARKVSRSLRGFPGVEEVRTDCKESRVVVKAAKSVDPLLVLNRLQKKTTAPRTVQILSPLPPPPKHEEEDQPPPPPQPKSSDPNPDQPLTTLLLHVAMHCEACAHVMQKRIRKIKGVESVETDVANDRVTVKGKIDNPDSLVQLIYKRTRKQASIVKEEEKPEKGGRKPSENDVEKKEECEKKDDVDEGEDVDSNLLTKSEHWHGRTHMEYYYANYTPQMFSDENPNACSVM